MSKKWCLSIFLRNVVQPLVALNAQLLKRRPVSASELGHDRPFVINVMISANRQVGRRGQTRGNILAGQIAHQSVKFNVAFQLMFNLAAVTDTETGLRGQLVQSAQLIADVKGIAFQPRLVFDAR